MSNDTPKAEAAPTYCDQVWPRDTTGQFVRVLLEVALLEGNFKLELRSKTNTALNDPEVLGRALERTKEYLQVVMKPEAALRERWKLEDEERKALKLAEELTPQITAPEAIEVPSE